MSPCYNLNKFNKKSSVEVFRLKSPLQQSTRDEIGVEAKLFHLRGPMKTKKEQGSYTEQGEGFFASQMRLIVTVNLFMLVLSVGFLWPYRSERLFFGLQNPVTATIALALVLMGGFLLPIWLAQGSAWTVARRREYATYFVSPATAQRINPKKLIPFVLRLRFNANTVISALYIPEAIDAPAHMPNVMVVYLAYLLLMMGAIIFLRPQSLADEVLFFFVRSGAVGSFFGAWAHFRQPRSG